MTVNSSARKGLVLSQAGPEWTSEKQCLWELEAVAPSVECVWGPYSPSFPAPILTWDASPLPPYRELSWGAMNSHRDRGVTCTSSDLLDGGGGGVLPQHTQFHLIPNGHPATGLPDQAIQPRISVPKMGVRARIAEWPPRRAQSRESLLDIGQIGNGSSHHGDDCSTSVSSSVLSSDIGLVRGGAARLPRRRSKDVEFKSGGFGGERGSHLSLRVLPPLRQRSNSELTLSEQDENEVSLKSSFALPLLLPFRPEMFCVNSEKD